MTSAPRGSELEHRRYRCEAEAAARHDRTWACTARAPRARPPPCLHVCIPPEGRRFSGGITTGAGDGSGIRRFTGRSSHRTIDLLQPRRRSVVRVLNRCLQRRFFRRVSHRGLGVSPLSVPSDADPRSGCRDEKVCRCRPFCKRLMGFEPTTFCMASRRSSQLSYSRKSGRV
jgi:hypothetical protein